MHESVGHFNADATGTGGTTPAGEPGSAGAVPPDPVGRRVVTAWVIQSYRAGENAQLLGLAERLEGWLAGRADWSQRLIRVDYRRRAGLLGLLRRCSLGGIKAASAAQLGGPWPDLLITAGLRNEPLCAWIRQASGGRTRVIFIGRTWQRHQRFDLLVTTPQYRTAPSAHVQVNPLTQHRVTPDRLAAAARSQGAVLARLARPRLGVLLGGSSGPYVLGKAAANDLADRLAALAKATGGTIAITSSSRTPHHFLEALRARLDPATWAYHWRPDDPDNPYFALLASADALIVTGDSVAMLSEAAATGRPVLIYDVPTGRGADSTLAARWYRFMMRWLPARVTRDVALFHRQFVAAGLGRMLDESVIQAAAAGDLLRPVSHVECATTAESGVSAAPDTPALIPSDTTCARIETLLFGTSART